MINWRSAGHVAVALMLVTLTGAMQPPQGQARRALPSDLTKPIGQYTGNEFFNLVNGLNYVGGQDRVRGCRGAPGCGNTLRTNVRVDAIAGTDSIGPNNLPQFGVVVARAINRGQATEAMYGMLSTGANGRYSYYLIVLPNPDGPRWRLEQLSIQGNNRTHTLLAQGRFTPCNHPFVPGARADFRSCAQAATPASNGVLASFLQGNDPPMWVTCLAGCCVADGGSGV
jgi:hypothetical protein